MVTVHVAVRTAHASLQEDFKRMLSSNPSSRLRPAEFLGNSIFEEEYVSLQLFLETLNVKDAVEKDRFFSKLAERVPALPKAAATCTGVMKSSPR